MTSGLKLFRRHEVGCTQEYPKDLRVYESAKTTGRRQCACPIYAEGTVRNSGGRKRYIRPKSTGERQWSEARRIVAQWEQSGDSDSPAIQPESAYQLISVADAVQHFYAIKAGQNAAPSTIHQFQQLLDLRLIPFANSRGIRYVQDMDNAQVWADFRSSWRNLNPLRNRRPVPGRRPENSPLAPTTARRLVEELREFIRICISREWLSENWASSAHSMKVETSVEPKEPFSPNELDAVYKGTSLISDGRGFKNKRTNQPNARELLVFV